MRNQNTIIIHGWMINILKLRGNKLIGFAIVYGFSQDLESEFKGSLTYLQKSLSCSRKTAIKSMSDLEEEGFVFKRKEIVSGVEVNRYRITEEVVEKLHTGSVKTTHGGSGETTHKNTIKGNTIEKGSSLKIPFENEKPNGGSGKILFENSRWNNYLLLRKRFGNEKSLREKYAGADLKYYIEAVLLWSDKEGKKRTDRGWLATIRTFMNGDLQKGKFVTMEMKKPAQELSLKERLKNGGSSSV